MMLFHNATLSQHLQNLECPESKKKYMIKNHSSFISLTYLSQTKSAMISHATLRREVLKLQAVFL